MLNRRQIRTIYHIKVDFDSLIDLLKNDEQSWLTENNYPILFRLQMEFFQKNRRDQELQTLILSWKKYGKINTMQDYFIEACSLNALELKFSNNIWETNHEAISALIDSSKRSLVSISLGFYQDQKDTTNCKIFEMFSHKFNESARDMISLRNFSININFQRQSISQLLLKSIRTNISQLETLKIKTKNQSDEFPLICQIMNNNKSTLKGFSLRINSQWMQYQNVSQFFQVLQELDCLEKLELKFSDFKKNNLKILSNEGQSNISQLKSIKSLSLYFKTQTSLSIGWKQIFNALKTLESLEELCLELRDCEGVPWKKIAKIISKQQNSLRKLTLCLKCTDTSWNFSSVSKEIKKLTCLDSLTLNFIDQTSYNNRLFQFLLELSNLKSLAIQLNDEETLQAFVKYVPVIFQNKLKLNHLILNFSSWEYRSKYKIKKETINQLKESLLKCKELTSIQLDENLNQLFENDPKHSLFKRKLPYLIEIIEISSLYLKRRKEQNYPQLFNPLLLL